MEKLIAFLKKSVVGKTLFTDLLIYKPEEGLEGEYQDRMIFSNLKYSEEGLTLDLTVISDEKVYVVDEKGERVALRIDFSGSALFRYELAKRKSTGEITGVFRFISSTGESTAEAVASAVYDFKVGDEEVSFCERQMLYRDQPAKEGAYRPVAFDARCRLYLEAGKLRYQYDGVCYDVDSLTMERKLSESVFPPVSVKGALKYVGLATIHLPEDWKCIFRINSIGKRLQLRN